MITDLPKKHNGPLVPSPEAQWDVGAIAGHYRAVPRSPNLALLTLGTENLPEEPELV